VVARGRMEARLAIGTAGEAGAPATVVSMMSAAAAVVVVAMVPVPIVFFNDDCRHS